MDSLQAHADRLAIYLAAYKHYVEIKSNAGLLDIAKFGEPLARDLVEIAFGYNDLVNLNLRTNFPAIDLGSTTAGCAFQVTTNGETAKIIETQQKFLEHKLDSKYPKLKFIILRDKQGTYESQRIVRTQGDFSFDPMKDIYDLGDLYTILVAEADPTKFEAFYKRLESELGSGIRPYLLGADLPGQHLRDLFEAHGASRTDAVKALKQFGVNRDIYSKTTSLGEAASKDLIQYVAEQFCVSCDWIDGTYAHIYSGGPGAEERTDWRRKLRGAYDLVKSATENGERFDLIIPDEDSLSKLDAVDDVVDTKMSNYEHFFLVARKKNDFLVDRFRQVISDPLSYGPCRVGIFLLFVAAEIFEIETQQKTYIDVYVAPRAAILSCYHGDKLLIDVYESDYWYRNHKDFIYSDGRGRLTATKDVPSRLAPLLNQCLSEFAGGRSASLPVEIMFL